MLYKQSYNNHITNMSVTQEKFDGGQSVGEQIKGVRHNLTDKSSMALENPDNSFGHGGATHHHVRIKKKSIDFLDNGTFKKYRQQYAWCKNKSKFKEDYAPEAIKGKIAKWNCGLTESSWVWGDKAKLIVKNTEDNVTTYSAIPANWNECADKNEWPYIKRTATPQEEAEMEECIKTFNGENWKHATLIKFYDLVDKNDTTTGPDLYKKYKGLYVGKYKDKIVTIKDEINKTEQVIKYDTDKKGSQMISETFKYLTNGKKKGKILRKGERNYDDKFNFRFEYKVEYGILTEEEIQKEKTDSCCTPAQMTGHHVHREDRLVSGSLGLKLGGSLGMYRNMGGRVNWYFPADPLVDNILGIGTNKEMRENNWSHIKNKSIVLNKQFTQMFVTTNDMWEKKQKKKKEDGMKELKKKTKEVPQWDLTTLEKERISLLSRYVGKKFKGDDDELYDGRTGPAQTAKKLAILIERAIEKKKRDGKEKEVTNTLTEHSLDNQVISNGQISPEDKGEDKGEEKGEEKGEYALQKLLEPSCALVAAASEEGEEKISDEYVPPNEQLHQLLIKIFCIGELTLENIQEYVINCYEHVQNDRN